MPSLAVEEGRSSLDKASETLLPIEGAVSHQISSIEGDEQLLPASITSEAQEHAIGLDGQGGVLQTSFAAGQATSLTGLDVSNLEVRH